MWMRIAGALAVAGVAFALFAFGGNMFSSAGAESGPDTATATPAPTSSTAAHTASNAYAIQCALDGSAQFDSTCRVERATLDYAPLLVAFHPDGGFRQFEQLPDGAGLAAVAGADTVSQRLNGDTLEIAIAANRYRFPATAQ